MVYLIGSKPGANGADKANPQNLTAMTYSKAYLKRTNQRVIRHEITGEKMLDVANKNKAKRAARVYPLKSKKGRRDVFAEIFA